MAQCIELDVASQGRTEKAALKNLQEALELHFAPPAIVIPERFYRPARLREPNGAGGESRREH